MLFRSIGYEQPRARQVIATLVGAAWTVAGYAAVTSVMYSPAAAIGESLANLIQVGSGVLIGLFLGPVLSRLASGNGRS